MAPRLQASFKTGWTLHGPLIVIDKNSVRVNSSCPTIISSLDRPVCGEKEKCLYNSDRKYAMSQHLANNNIATCFEGCHLQMDSKVLLNTFIILLYIVIGRYIHAQAALGD